MKLEFAEDHVKGSHGLTEQKSFAIRTSAHAFKLLSSGLYSDKITAVLREIGCNATDAHIEAGTPDVPIEVKLPNRIDSQFYVRDFGLGLSHDDVMELYTTYFASTKQSSNAFTGAFGLGSKSPFSYTDSFTIVSAHKGEMRTYSAHLSNEGSPTIALLATQPVEANWPHGISIKFPVKPGDYSYFISKAQNTYQWFRIPPRIIGSSAIVPLTHTHDHPDFMMVAENNDHQVLMGNVHYPLNIHQIENRTPKTEKLAYFSGVILKLPIGSVQVAASREELQYDKPSMKVLNAACEAVIEHICADVEEHITKFHAANWADKCQMNVDTLKWQRNRYGSIPWRDVLLTSGRADAAEQADILRMRAIRLPDFAGTKTSCRVMRPAKRVGTVEYTPVHKGKTGGNYPAAVLLGLDINTKVLYGHAKHTLPRARSVLLDGTYKQVVLVTPRPGEIDEKDAAAEAHRLAKAMHGLAIDHIDTVPIPASAISTKVGGTKIKKLKNAHALPMLSMHVAQMDEQGSITPTDISKNLAIDNHFMAFSPGKIEGRFRSYHTTHGQDTKYHSSIWNRIWQYFVSLQEELGLVASIVQPLPTALQVVQLDLVKRGWKPTDSMIIEWLSSPPVQTGVAAAAAAWRPTVPINSYLSGWTGSLMWMRHTDKKSYDLVAPFLGKYDADIEGVLKASLKAGSSAGRTEPLAISMFNSLRSSFPTVPAPTLGKARTYTTYAELEEQFVKSHDMLEIYTPSQLTQLVPTPAKLAEFSKFLFK